MVECRQTAMVGHGQCQEINIGNLVVPHHPRPVEQARLSQGKAVWPQFIVKVGTDFVEFLADNLKPYSTESTVSREIENTYDTVLHKRGNRNFQPVPLDESQSLRAKTSALSISATETLTSDKWRTG